MTTAELTNEPPGGDLKPVRCLTDRPQAPRRYIYCLIDCGAPTTFGRIGIGGDGEVFVVRDRGVAAVVSATSAQKLEISRGSALAHQRVMEAVMHCGHTVLPVRFNTIAEDRGTKTAEQRIADHVLVGRRDEIVGLLSRMRCLVELGVKGLWTDLGPVFKDIVEGSRDIHSLREKLLGAGSPGAARRGRANLGGQIKLGEMVKKALEARKADMEAALLGRLAPLAADVRKNKTFGDPMFANLAILVEESRQEEVEAALSAFQAEHAGRAKLRCVGPLPPSNFLELVITWDD